MKAGYVPKPIDTSAVKLPQDVQALTERLAEHNHDIWALQKSRQGWRHGPADPKARTHPSLIPYHELPESEKDFDRNTAMECIKALYALGYRLSKKA